MNRLFYQPLKTSDTHNLNGLSTDLWGGLKESIKTNQFVLLATIALLSEAIYNSFDSAVLRKMHFADVKKILRSIFSPICSSKHFPSYHCVSSLNWLLVTRFSPPSPLVGMKATSDSWLKQEFNL